MVLPLLGSSTIPTRQFYPAPAQEAIDYHTVKFNGTFDVGSIYRGAPSPELDAAWNRLTEHGNHQRLCILSTIHTDNRLLVQPTRISKAMLTKMGKEDRPSLVKFREEDGGGYMASVETVHQLHCLVSRSLSLIYD